MCARAGEQEGHEGNRNQEPDQSRRERETLGVHGARPTEQGFCRRGPDGGHGQRHRIGGQCRQARASVLNGELTGDVEGVGVRRWGLPRGSHAPEAGYQVRRWHVAVRCRLRWRRPPWDLVDCRWQLQGLAGSFTCAGNTSPDAISIRCWSLADTSLPLLCNSRRALPAPESVCRYVHPACHPAGQTSRGGATESHEARVVFVLARDADTARVHKLSITGLAAKRVGAHGNQGLETRCLRYHRST